MARLNRQLSAVGFGAFKIGRNEGIKYPSPYDLPEPSAVGALLNGMLDLGINYIDTAPAYGFSEKLIGEAISHRRSEYVISTKVGETFENGQSVFDYSAHGVRSSVTRSLRRMKTEFLDIVFVHSSRNEEAVLAEPELVSTLEELRSDGWIGAIGFSGYSAAGFAAALPWCDAIMVTYNMQDRTLEPIIRQAADADVAVIVKKGLASGRLPADEAIQFVLDNPGVTSVLAGTLTLEHVRENIAVAQRVRGGAPGSLGSTTPERNAEHG